MCLQHRSVQLQNWIEIMTWCFKKLQSFLKINIWHCHSIYYSFASLTFKFGMQEFYSKWCFGRYVVHISCVTLPLPTVKSILWVLVASVAWYHSPFYFNFYGSSMSTEILPTIHFFLYKTFIHGIKKKMCTPLSDRMGAAITTLLKVMFTTWTTFLNFSIISNQSRQKLISIRIFVSQILWT